MIGLNLFTYPKKLNTDFTRRLCFLNNIRSKYLTVLLILCASIFTFYDVYILQKITQKEAFIINFKADIIFLVFSFIFALYIFFNQVKSHKDIRNHHKYIHGIISLFMILWSIFKSVVSIKFGDGDYSIAIISIVLTSFLFIFPTLVYLGQLIFSSFFALLISLIFNLTISQIFEDISIIIIISFIAMIISHYILHLQHKVLMKELEIIKYKTRINMKAIEKPE